MKNRIIEYNPNQKKLKECRKCKYYAEEKAFAGDSKDNPGIVFCRYYVEKEIGAVNMIKIYQKKKQYFVNCIKEITWKSLGYK